MRRIRSSTAIALVVMTLGARPAAASSSCGGSSGSGPGAICASVASDELWLYLMLDTFLVLFTAADLEVALGETPPTAPVHVINLVHHGFAGFTILGGALGASGSRPEAARFTLGLGAVSAGLAAMNTVVIALRHRKVRRAEKRADAF